ncbi:MAG: ABC transporter permease, partial [Deltaproteobacteria bacterium]|nr:ABC transporter permease [Deltaproteobacteria bacterium]
TGLASLGATLVILTGGIDLSVGSIIGVSGVVFGISFPAAGFAPAIILALFSGTLAGTISGLLVTKARLAPFVATLGMMAIARSQAYILSGAKSIGNLPAKIEVLGSGTFLGIPVNFLVLILAYGLMWLFLSRTKLGRSIYAVGSNEEAARLAGVATARVKTFCYAASGFTAAVACIFLSGRILSIDPLAGSQMEMDTIAAIVIGGASLNGGRGSIIGTLFGVFVMVLIRNGLNLMKVDPYWQGTAIGSVIILALVAESFFRGRRGERA